MNNLFLLLYPNQSSITQLLTPLWTNLSLLTRISPKPQQIRPTVVTMHIQHSLDLENLAEVQVRNQQALLFLTKVFCELASIWSDDAGTSSAANVVEFAVAEIHAVNAALGEEG